MHDLPISTRIKRAEIKPHSDIDSTRTCAVCQQQGLYAKNSRGICRGCHQKLPINLKSGPLALVDVELQHAKLVFAHLTQRDAPREQRLSAAADILRIDLDHLLYILEQPAANDD